MRRLTTALLLVVVALGLAVTTCCPGREMGSRDQIIVVTHRRFDDDGVMRIAGLVRNTGDLPTPESEIVATLHSRTGSFQGQNRVALSGLEPGAEEQFALGVDSHGRVETVEFRIVEPGAVVGEDDDAPENSAREGDQDAN
jgi:hypothetical protein